MPTPYRCGWNGEVHEKKRLLESTTAPRVTRRGHSPSARRSESKKRTPRYRESKQSALFCKATVLHMKSQPPRKTAGARLKLLTRSMGKNGTRSANEEVSGQGHGYPC